MIISYHFNPPNLREGVGNSAQNIINEIKADWKILYLPTSLKKLFYYTNLSSLWFAFQMFKLKPKIVVVHTLESSSDPIIARFFLKPFGVTYKILTIAHGTNKGVYKEYKKEIQKGNVSFSFSFFLNTQLSIFRSYFCKYSDKIFSVSHLVQEEVKKYYNKDSVLLYNGIPESFFLSSKPRQRKKLETILFFGNSYWIKGLIYLIKANNSLNPPKKLLVAGINKSQKEKILSLIKPLKTQFIGNISPEEKHKLYEKADIFCMPSIYESFGIVYLEALVYSLPCIASKETGAEDILKNGKNGYLVEKRNIEQLADKIKEAEKNIFQLSKNATLEKKFLWKNSLFPLKKEIETQKKKFI